MNNYIGHPLQTRGGEQYVLQDGRGNGMRFLFVRNGLGLEAWISLDRAGDLSRVTFKGDNFGYFSPCGYAAPAYYDKDGVGFLKSFTAGFFTTCGLRAVGSPCTDDGETLPLHGTVSHIPAVLSACEEEEDGLHVRLTVRDACLFAQKLVLRREYVFSYTDNTFRVCDKVTNDADQTSPYMILYHCNMGYPLLDEHASVVIPHTSVRARNERSQDQIALALQTEAPQSGYEECCFYFDVKETAGRARVGMFGNTIRKGLVMSFDKTELPCFTEWKMMGKTDYVWGLEPGNCTPDGRDVMRQSNTLRFLEPGQSGKTEVTFTFVDQKDAFDRSFL